MNLLVLVKMWLVLVIFLLIVSCVYAYLQYAFKYWKRKGVPHMKPGLFGNFGQSLRVSRAVGEIIKDQYDVMKQKGYKHSGMYFFAKPFYIPLDPTIIKSVLVKDFQSFHARGLYYNEKSDPLSAHLFSLDGEKWRNLRAKLSPTFTSGKLKKMFTTLVDCSTELASCLNDPISKDEPIDLKNISQKYTTYVIGSCAFGLECNSFKQPNTEFIRLGRKAFAQDFTDRLKFFFAILFPKIASFLEMRVTNIEVHNFFTTLVKDTVEYREKNNVVRNDFLQLLIDLKNKHLQEEEQPEDLKSPVGTTLSMGETSAQAFVFFIAGFETSSTAMTFAFYEIAKNEDIQNKLRKNIVEVLKKHEGKITYESLHEMTYLEQVLQETLRKYPPVPFLRRVVTTDFQIPDTDITLEKDTVVMISVLGIHRDPEYYPDPDIFDPERFNSENKTFRPDFTFLPFGDGPRNCIGLRFGLLQAKVGICQIIKNYKIKLHPKTVEPLEFDPKSAVLSPKNTFWFSASRVSE